MNNINLLLTKLLIVATIVWCISAFPAQPQRNIADLNNDKDSMLQDDPIFTLDEPISIKKDSSKNETGAESSVSASSAKQDADGVENLDIPKEVEGDEIDAISEAMLAMGGMVSDEPIDMRTLATPSVQSPVDYYDYLSMPVREVDDGVSIVPAAREQEIAPNDDYAGIYDYRGQHVGRFRRKRTLTTNLEQFITRQSRLSRSKRSLSEPVRQSEPEGQQETLLTLLTALAETKPDFSVQEFLRALDEPKVDEEDLDYLLYLSNLATQREKEMLDRQDALEEALFQNHAYLGMQAQPFEEFIPEQKEKPFVMPQNLPRQNLNPIRENKKRNFNNFEQKTRSRKPIPAEPDLTGLYAIATLLAQDDASAMAM